MCRRCGVAHDAALDFAPCVSGIVGQIIDWTLTQDRPDEAVALLTGCVG